MPADYVRAVERAGGRALLVPPSRRRRRGDARRARRGRLLRRLRPRPRDLRPGPPPGDGRDRRGARPRRAGAAAGRARARHARAGDLPRLAAAERRARRRPRPAPTRRVGDEKHKQLPGRVRRPRRAARAGDRLGVAARRPRAGQVAPPPGLRPARRGPARVGARRRRHARGARRPLAPLHARRALAPGGRRGPAAVRGARRARRGTTASTAAVERSSPSWSRRIPDPVRARAPQRGLDLRPRHLGRSAAAGLPDPRRAEGRHDGALRVPAPPPVRSPGPSWKEVSYFDRHYARGESWYRGNFPNKSRARAASSSARRARATSSTRSARSACGSSCRTRG